jgi:hypothetical protein
MAEDKESLESIMEKQETESTEETTVTEPETSSEEQEGQEEGFKGKFSHIKAKSAEEYAKKIEELYSASSQEGRRLDKELKDKQKEIEIISKVVQENPELREQFANTLYSGDYDAKGSELTPAQIRQIIREELGSNPQLKRQEEDRRAKDLETYQKFLSEHPEIDQSKEEELGEYFGALAQAEVDKGRVPDFEKTLRKAYKVISDDGELEGMKKVMQKESAAQSSSTPDGAPKGARALSPQERSVAQALGLTDEQYLDGKKLSEEAK